MSTEPKLTDAGALVRMALLDSIEYPVKSNGDGSITIMDDLPTLTVGELNHIGETVKRGLGK